MTKIIIKFDLGHLQYYSYLRTMILNLEDTIAAPATIPGTGAITIIRISGPDTFKAVDRIVEFTSGDASSAKGYTIKYGTIKDKDGSPLDDVLVSIFRSPHSYTGEDSAEISCHASPYIASRIMEILLDNGVRAAAPGEFTRRAFVGGKMDLAQSESVADLIASQGEASHRIAMNQLRGGFSKELLQMRSELLDAASLMELELDFSEEDVEFANREKLLSLLGSIIAHLDRLISSFRKGNAIRNGIPVAIVGPANAGKSTLLNSLLGEERAIVSEIEGTTRDTIEETINFDGILLRFIDTAGIRSTDESIEKLGIERTFKKISEADMVICMLDSSLPYSSFIEVVDTIIDKTDYEYQKVIFLLNKIDKIANNKNVNEFNNFVSYIENHTRKYINKVDCLEISAKEGIGIKKLSSIISDYCKSIASESSGTLVTNLRHLQALTASKASLLTVREGIESDLSTELVAEDLRESIRHLSEITEPISDWELLGNIFSRFCVGK
jgi:tRNA modification GTPase